jgi:putative FmdB family regulatory protein
MPTYEYVCDACEHGFEEFQSFSEAPLKKCPKCGKLKLRRLFGSGAAILFKGSGFYQTDYRSESYKSAAKAEQEAAKPATGAADKTGTNGTADNGAAKPADKPAKKSPKSTT